MGEKYQDEALTEREDSFVAITAQEQLDTDTVVTAVRSKNKAFCDTVLNADQKADCQVKVADAIALEAGDCGKIQQDNTAKKCNILAEDIEKLAKLEEKNALEQELVNQITESGVLADCESLELEHFRTQCVMNISLNQASENKDPAVCDNILNEAVKAICIENAVAL